MQFSSYNKYSHIATDYSGSIYGLSDQRYSNYFTMNTLLYKHTFSRNLFMMFGAGMTLNSISNNDLKRTQCNPYAYYQIGYNPNSKIRFNGSLYYTSNSVSVGQSADLLSQVNEVEWVQGNPNLKDDRYLLSNIYAVWIPSGVFNMSANFSLSDQSDTPAPYWTPNGEIMLKQYLADGNVKTYTAEICPAVNLFNYRLRLSSALAYHRDILNGQQHNRYNYWTARFNANYQIAGFSFGGYVYSPIRMLNLDQLRKFPLQYGLSVDYYYNNWSFGISALQLFSTRGYNKYWQDTPTYRYYETNYTKFYGRQLCIKVAYTFDYGKAVDKTSELNTIIDKEADVLK